MRRTRRTKRLQSSDDETSKKTPPKQKKTTPKSDDSSSESDIENYLQPINKIDWNSPFFNTQQQQQPESFEKIEKQIARLTDSSSDDDNCNPKPTVSEKDDNKAATTSKLNFQQLQDYTKKLEDAKQHIANYNAKKQQLQRDNVDIFNMLKSTEMKSDNNQQSDDFHSSDFESCSESEKEGWETVNNQEHNEKVEIPKEGVQITIEMPNAIRKKKGVDLIATMKRRFNRIRKENQIYVHKVHLLCWIAHGNYVNSIINNEKILACALSLLPSDKCYPSERTDLKYLEQIVRWYNNTIQITQKVVPKNESLDELLMKQIEKKVCYNQKMFVYIFIAILRALGIHCRLVLSFRVEPLRPPASELCSLSTKVDKKPTSKTDENTSKLDHSKSEKLAKKVGKKPKFTPKVEAKEEQKIGRSPKRAEVGSSTQKIKSTGKKTVQSGDDKLAGKSKKLIKIQIDEKPLENMEAGSSIQKLNEGKENGKSRKLREKIESSIDKKPKFTAKIAENTEKRVEKNFKRGPQKPTKTRSKSTADQISETTKNQAPKTRSKSTSTVKQKTDTIKIKLPQTDKIRNLRSRNNNNNNLVPQVDGIFNDTDEDIPQLDGTNDEDQDDNGTKKLRAKKKLPKYKDTDSEDEFDSPSSSSKSTQKSDKKSATSPRKSPYFATNNVAEDVVKLVKNRIKQQKEIDQSKMVKKRKHTKNDTGEDSDYIPEQIQKKHHDSDDEFVSKTKVKRRIPAKPIKVLSSDDEDDGKSKKKKHGNDVWVEVFLENEEKWICCDLIAGQVHCVNQLYNRATHPISYIVAWNNDNTLKDITKRYCQNFNTITRKLRIDAKWWEETLKPFIGKRTVRDKEEDDELERQQLEKPLPTSIAEYKNHPLYVLKRHLLKFEGIYPPDPPPLGFVRNEPVYSRQCVYTLHSRDIWLKHAKVVKPGEKPYKIVKARPKYDKLSNTVITDQMLEIFGPWQTEDYVPPTAENGVVPRNAFGNVELFKPCMLPKKTVHLKLPGLNKIARRLNIDCASAITGFDFHSGWSHPVYDGFVVCEEFADQLVAAWELDQEEQEKKEREKVEKRVYTNWKRLIRGLLIRERLKAKYDFGAPSTSDGGGAGGKGKKKMKGPRVATKKKRVHSGSEDSGSE